MRRLTLLLYVFGAAGFTFLYWQPPFNSPGISLADLTAFRGATPYQYRVLMPLLASILSLLMPFSIPFLYAALTFAFTFGLLYVWRLYLQNYLPLKADFYALALLYPLIWNYVVVSGIRYPWDIPAILFFVWGLVAIQRAQWRLYYFVFFLACLNRETSCFLILAFVLLNAKRHSVAWITGNTLGQLTLWLAIKILLTHFFQQNAGEKVFENHVVSNLHFVVKILREPRDSFDWIFLTFGWMLLPIVFGWRVLPVDLKRLLGIAPPFVIGMLFAGDFGQARIHNELVPVLLAPALWCFEQFRLRWRGSKLVTQA